MEKEDVVIEIAGLSLRVKNRDNLFKQPTLNLFVLKSRKTSKRAYSFSKLSSGYPADNIYSYSRLISYAFSKLLALNKGMLLHAAAVVKDGKAFLFFGVQGAGKSTIARLSKRYKVLGDDIIAVRKAGNHYYAFSTPWKQSSFIRPGRGAKGEIAAIFFIKKSDRISFKSLQPEHALMRMLSSHIHFLIYTKRSLAKKIFFTAADFTKRIPAYEMEFEKTRDFWRELDKEISVARP